MNKQNVPIAAAIVGILVTSAVYVTSELRTSRVEYTGVNMITTAVVDRAGATITETKRPSKPWE
jgi:hypothetical protein